jgi:hypothetical protein
MLEKHIQSQNKVKLEAESEFLVSNKFRALTNLRFFFGFDPGTPIFFLNPRKKKVQ